MNDVWWQTIGEGNCHLVLLHGWGLNARVWDCLIPRLSSHFTLHLVDLPGYGRSNGFDVLSLSEMVPLLLRHAPERAIWLGWSLGGLVASQVALSAPEQVQGLVTVASSPCFCANSEWPGISAAVLNSFQLQLYEDFQHTVARFLALQTSRTEKARHDASVLKNAVLSLPMPSVTVLNSGLEILKTTDLRQPLTTLTLPFLRLYGRLDSLVPRKIIPCLDALWPHSQSVIFDKAVHAPFISHPEQFCTTLITLKETLLRHSGAGAAPG
ncbi:pimeloyl-ACP methyl ester esterase BioH [Enterobacteriaceae bacterium ESL0689]|nr:pimeloyl-ACP methyl ester esterase BioH [Enterobacteriaceae bacterium ESL0689]